MDYRKSNTEKDMFSQALASRVSQQEVRKWIKSQSRPFKELMTYYECAIMEVETKFRVLNEQFSLGNDSNPIETIKSRLKSPESIVEKMLKNNFPLTAQSIEENLHDVAGIRIICSTVSDIYMLEEALLRQDDVTLVQRKDYFANPKPNGYRSLHLIISTPIFLCNQKKMMKVEVQLRTLAMDAWASLEHKVLYKKDDSQREVLGQELLKCADLCAEFDNKMQSICDSSQNLKNSVE